MLNLNTGIGDDHYRFMSTDFFPSLRTMEQMVFAKFEFQMGGTPSLPPVFNNLIDTGVTKRFSAS